MASRALTIDLALDQSSIYKLIELPTKELLAKTVEEFERENPLYMIYNLKQMGQLQETYTSSVGSDRIKFRTAEFAAATLGEGGQEGFSGTKRYRMYSGAFKISKQLMLEAKQSGNFNAVAYNIADRTKTWLRNNVEDGIRAILGGFGYAVLADDGTDYMFVTTDTVDGRTGQYAVNSQRLPLFSNAHTLVRKSGWTDAEWAAKPRQSNLYVAQDGANFGIDLLGNDPGKIAKLSDIINVVITNMENQLDDNGKPAGMHGPKEIVAPNDARLKAALKSALDEPSLRGFGDQTVPNPAYGRVSKCNFSVYYNFLECLFDSASNTARGFFIVDKGYMAANNGMEISQRFPMEVTSGEHKNPAHLEVIFSEGLEYNCLTWRGITLVIIKPVSNTVLFTIPAAKEATNTVRNLPVSAATAVSVVSTIAKPINVVASV
jgi:hypothetical protein